MAAAAPMPPGRARAAGASVGYGQFPNSYFSHLFYRVPLFSWAIVGQILYRTRWGEGVVSLQQQAEWFRPDQKKWAEQLGITDRGLRNAVREAGACIEERQVGRYVEYRCVVEQFIRMPVRESSRSGNPAPERKTPGQGASVPCSADLLAICPLPELAHLEASELKTKGKTPQQRNSRSAVESARGKAHRNSRSAVESARGKAHRNSRSAVRPGIRGIVEQFTARFGVGPGDDVLIEIQRALGDASEEQFAAAVAAKAVKVRSYKFLALIAHECAQTAGAWQRQHGPVEPRLERRVDPAVCPGVGSRSCGKPKAADATICDKCVEYNRHQYAKAGLYQGRAP